MTLRKIVDPNISDREFAINPNSGKYRIEIFPINKVASYNDKLCLVMLTKQLSFIPFLTLRKAVICEDDESVIMKIIMNEYPGYDYYDIRFFKTDVGVYPRCKIQSIDFSSTSTIRFMNEKQVDQWIKPIGKAIDQYNKYYEVYKR